MCKKTIALLLKSPIQAWGIDSHFKYRTSFPYPTKSAVIGIVCAAMGIDKYSPKTNDELKNLCECDFCSYQLYPVGESEFTKFINTPVLTDFHTIGGGYDKSNPLHKRYALSNAKGKLSYGEAIITYRNYIQDTCFVALLTYSQVLAEKVAKSLKNPMWGIWLGRKSCIPSVPIFGGIYDLPEDALSTAIERLNSSGSIKYKAGSILQEAKDFEDTETSIQDIPVDFKNRIFASRNIKIDHNANI